MAGIHEDDYRSSDDEDYNPDNDEIDPNDEIDDHVEADLLEGDMVKADAKSTVTEPGASCVSSSEDVDALFAELTGEDPFLTELNRRKKIEICKETVEQVTRDESKEKKDEDTNIEKRIEVEVKTFKKETPPDKPEPAKSIPNKKRSSLLDAMKALSKRSKLSLLEKSERDWKEFKTENKISEDLASHNRGKNGYLNKLEFLNRTDNREFENEKRLRAIARKDQI